MLAPETIKLVKQEQHTDRIKQLQRQQLFQEAGPRNAQWEAHKKAVGWLGNRMVKWGARLETYGTATRSKAMTLKS